MQNILESLKRQREQILADSSEELLGRHTSLLEIAIISLYNRLVNRLNLDSEQFRSSGAVLGLGDFGRGLIGPNQPVPIIYLKADGFPWKDDWLDEITLPLSEAGWIVEAQQDTAASLLKRAREDLPFFLQLIEARYISGNRQLVDQFDRAVEVLIEERREELLDWLYGSVQARLNLLEDPNSWLEPDLVHNPGGLSEISTIRAACRVASNIRTLQDAIFRGYLVRQEVDHLQRTEKAFARLLSLPRDSSDKLTTVLSFDEQEFLARKLGYSARAGFLPVESFMQQVYQLFHGVIRVSREFWERLQETRSILEEEETKPEEILEEGLSAQGGKIHIHTDRYPATAGHLVHLFTVAAARGMGFANVTRQWVQHHSNVLDSAAGDSMVKRDLLELIRSETPELSILRRFYDLGLLTSLIPELAAVHGLVQHDAFHLYPVHEHHLRTLSELKKLMAGEYLEEEPELTGIARELGDPICLFLAGLLHDIGKSSGRGHALHGGEMIPAIARRLGLSPEEADTVRFLVAQHLLLMDSASMRDLADEEMLTRCAMIIRTSEQLNLLALLSFADMAATGPKAQQKWRDTPLIPLYERICHLLEKGEPTPEAILEKTGHIREQVAREIADLMDSVELEEYFSQMAPRYILSMSPGDIARHLRLQWQLNRSDEPFVWEMEASDGTARITLMGQDKPALLSRVAGVLTLHDMNIIQAQIFTMNNGVTLLIFRCRALEAAGLAPDWDGVKADMGRLLLGKMALDYRIAAHAATRREPQAPSRHVQSQILIDNDSSAMYTILEVYTLDRVGLLYTISRTLNELHVRIYVAKITTKIDQVADVFYIRTMEGNKVTDPEQIDEIKNALSFWLDGTVGS
jgi:[protein-PII] uridylyltransferase